MMPSPCNPSLPAALPLHAPASHLRVPSQSLCIPSLHLWHCPAARLFTSQGTGWWLCSPSATAGVTPPLPQLLLLPGTPRRDGCIQWLQVGAGKGPRAPPGLQGALPGASRSVGARSCLLHMRMGLGRGHGTQVCVRAGRRPRGPSATLAQLLGRSTGLCPLG